MKRLAERLKEGPAYNLTRMGGNFSPDDVVKMASKNRSVGVGGSGDVPCADVNQIACNFSQIPVNEYVTLTGTVPLTDAAIAATFGDEIEVMQTTKTAPPGIQSVDSSFVQNGTLQCDMLAFGIGIHAFGEPLSFSQIGNAMTPLASPGGPIMSPDTFTQNDLIHNAMGQTSGILPAEMEWGDPTWNALWHMMNGYQFVWTVMQRYAVIQELAADVAYFGPYAEGAGAGTSEVIVQQYARQINNTYRNLALPAPPPPTFVPVNARRVGSVTTGAPGAVNTGVFHPTRDFDLAPAFIGGLRNQGTTGNPHPFRKFAKPVLVERGIPIGMSLKVQDQYHQTQMQRYLSVTEGLGGAFAQVGLDAQINGLTLAGTASTFLEITLDPGASNTFANQQVQSDRVLFKGGCFKIAMLIKGVEVWGAWKQYCASQIGCGAIAAPSITGGGGGPVGMLPVGQ